MIDLGFYEKVVTVSGRGKSLFVRILIITAYILSLTLWIVGAYSGGVSPVIILLVSLAISGVTFVLLRRNDIEYEYAISDTTVTLAKIYGKSKRKELFSADSGSILYVAPYNESNINKAQSYRPVETHSIYSPNTEEKLWLMVFENEEEKNVLFIFEAEDEVSKILKKLKPSVLTFM